MKVNGSSSTLKLNSTYFPKSGFQGSKTALFNSKCYYFWSRWKHTCMNSPAIWLSKMGLSAWRNEFFQNSSKLSGMQKRLFLNSKYLILLSRQETMPWRIRAKVFLSSPWDLFYQYYQNEQNIPNFFIHWVYFLVVDHFMIKIRCGWRKILGETRMSSKEKESDQCAYSTVSKGGGGSG